MSPSGLGARASGLASPLLLFLPRTGENACPADGRMAARRTGWRCCVSARLRGRASNSLSSTRHPAPGTRHPAHGTRHTAHGTWHLAPSWKRCSISRMAHDPYPAHLTRRHLLQLLGTGAGLGLLPRTAVAALAQSARAAAATPGAEDWPEVGGKGRLSVWNETGILEKFPADGLKVLWRTPVRSGYAGPAVADGRVFVADYVETQRPRGVERALALDEKTGKILWTQEWPADYRGISWPVGPRATPTVDGDRVYVLGADGKLLCLDVKTGAIIWQKDFVQGLRRRSPEVGVRLGLRQRAAGRRRPADRAGRRPARREGRGVRQDDRQGNLARAVHRRPSSASPSRSSSRPAAPGS